MPRLATIIICIIISTVLVFFLLWPQYQKFSDARWQVKEKQTERDNQEEYFNQIGSLSKELEGYKEQKEKIASALPSSPDAPDLLNFLANAILKNGMNLEKITSFSSDQSKKTTKTASGKEESVFSGAKEIIVEFDVKGEYENLKNFISTLEESARIIEVESISLNKKLKQVEGDSTPSFSFKIKAYYY